jgi:hypothetical protein
VSADFGVVVTSDNVEAHLANIRTQRELGANKNTDVVQLLQNWSLEP